MADMNERAQALARILKKAQTVRLDKKTGVVSATFADSPFKHFCCGEIARLALEIINRKRNIV